MSRYLDLHVLQTVPPSNLNRDDTGSPKSAVYGGVRRARVSSQAWKRAVRKKFPDLLGNVDDLGVSTKRVVDLLRAEITHQAPNLADSSIDLAEGVLTALKIKLSPVKVKDDDPARTKESGYLLFLSNHQVRALAGLAIASASEGTALDARQVKLAAQSANSIDVALFGRMVADDTDINVDACAQVAHALSVHGVETEYDYFTAMDDIPLPEQAGAGMIGTVEFNSSTLYRYATVDLVALRAALGDDRATERAVAAFTEAFITSMPTGKQNTFANRTLPDAVVVQVRSDQPVNLVGAFESAVTETAGRATTAAALLRAHSDDLADAFGAAPDDCWTVAVGGAKDALAGFGQAVTMARLLDGVRASVSSAAATP